MSKIQGINVGDTPFQRSRELDELVFLLAATVGGAGRAALINGTAASGKSTLLRAFTERAAAAGALVLRAGGFPAEETRPFGVVEQLIRSADVPARAGERIEQLLSEGRLLSAADLPVRRTQIIWRLCQELLEAGGNRPLVIGVDDLHYADLPSQHCLAALTRRAGASLVMLVFTASPRLQPVRGAVYADLMRSSQCLVVPVPPLTVAQIEETLRHRLGSGAAVGTFARFTAGNPLLLRGLIQDSLAAGVTGPVAGKSFAEAVLDCLYRSEPLVIRVAQMLALAGEPVEPRTAAQLLRMETAMAERAMQSLDSMGLLDGRQLRCPAARQAIMTSMAPDDRAAMRRELAWLLHVGGERPDRVARHLVLADRIDEGWQLPVLREAAGQAITDGATAQALSLLHSARPACADDHQAAELTAMLTQVLWRTDPSTLLSHVAPALNAVRDGLLPRSQAFLPIAALLWFGRFGQAGAALREMYHGDNAVEAGYLELWIRYAFSHCVDGSWRGAVEPSPTASGPRGSSVTYAVRKLTESLDTTDSAAQAQAAMDLLTVLRLDDISLLPATVALTVLVEGDRPDLAETWTERFLAEAIAARAPVWEARLSAVRAHLALRRGDLQTAQTFGDRALELMPAPAWGIHLGSLLSTLVTTATCAGRHEHAARYLAEMMPADDARTRYGVMCLFARGLHHLATGRLSDAANDFRACGDSMAVMGADMPVTVPWRIALAQAYQDQDAVAQSLEHAEEHLRLLGEGPRHARGATLRVLAATRPARQRESMLREAIEHLQAAGDRLGLALTYEALSETLEKRGEVTRAGLTKRTAEHIAAQSRAYGLLRRTGSEPGPGCPPSRARHRRGGEATLRLSDAERRVAALAASGSSNREIANRLFLTVSTVEQHLTKVYRKLGVTSRTDLSPTLYDAADAD